MNVFPMNDDHQHSQCMRHCEKLGTRSPSVKLKKEWEFCLKDLKAFSPDLSKLSNPIWLSATEGDMGLELGKPNRWLEGVEAKEGVWRDFYSGEQLENYTNWIVSSGDNDLGETYNCILFNPQMEETRTWSEFQCHSSRPRGCPCTFDYPPLIHLRGFCPYTSLEHYRYTVTQSPTDLSEIILVGRQSARIEYDPSLNQWIYSDPRLNVTAKSSAIQKSFSFGKSNWTISGDKYQCSEGKEYTLEMKMTGCSNKQFTCDDGQCVKMEERCDQLPNCDDQSDEQNCKVLLLQHLYIMGRFCLSVCHEK